VYRPGVPDRSDRMHPNEKMLRDSDETQVRGDAAAFMGFYTDHVIVCISGKSSFAGVHTGKAQLAEFFGRFMERAPEYTFESHAYFADDQHRVIL
jgi:hypothetical protein